MIRLASYIDKTCCEDELARGKELVFAASGITKDELLEGVRLVHEGAIVQSLRMRLPSGTIERSETTLRFKKHQPPSSSFHNKNGLLPIYLSLRPFAQKTLKGFLDPVS